MAQAPFPTPGWRSRRAIVAVAMLLIFSAQVVIALPAHAITDRNWHYKLYNLEWVHSISTGRGVTIAVVDTQVNIELPTFTGQDITAVGNFCPPSATGVSASAVSTEDHAAHATAIVNALAGNGSGRGAFSDGLRGIAPDATIRVYAVSDSVVGSREYCVASGDTPGSDNSRTAIASAAAIRQAISDDVDIINLSQQGDRYGDVERAIAEAVDAGIIVVVGSGNDGVGTINPLATIPGVLAVAALSPDESSTDQLKPWPDSGTDDEHVLTAAVGDQLVTGWVNSEGVWDDSYGVAGTSFAAPMVSGALALAKAQYPEANRAQLVENLIHTTMQRPLQYRPETGLGSMSPVELIRNNPLTYPPTPDRITTMTPAELASAEAESEYQELVTAWGKTYEVLDPPSDHAQGTSRSILDMSGSNIVIAAVFGAAMTFALLLTIAISKAVRAKSRRQREAALGYGLTGVAPGGFYPQPWASANPSSTPNQGPGVYPQQWAATQQTAMPGNGYGPNYPYPQPQQWAPMPPVQYPSQVAGQTYQPPWPAVNPVQQPSGAPPAQPQPPGVAGAQGSSYQYPPPWERRG